eukprot:TRINITY_DN8601_c0_g1_i1.p1 TRINITY_DN8601_c0_g1~~TRINITY_DN8601_c0_g1_i1.p1  ORF type:complete len:229 (+),score=35.88 TRINITY_DN8601_c0_g1_i1:83-769(+)
MKYLVYVTTLICLFSIVCCNKESNQRVVLQLEHSLDDGKTFQQRGELSFRNRGAFMLTDLKKISKSATFVQDRWSIQQIALLRNVSESDGFYVIRVHSSNPFSPFVIASIKACYLFSSRLEDELTLHLDTQNNVIALSYKATTNECDCSFSDELLLGKEPKTSVELNFGSEGPDVNLEALRINEELKKQKEQGSQSFLYQNWHYIAIAVALFLVLQFFLMEPEEAKKQ